MLCASFTAIPMSLIVYTFVDGIFVTTLIWADDDSKQHETCPLLFLSVLSVLPSAKKHFLNDKPLKRSNLILKRRNQSRDSKLCGSRSVRFVLRNSYYYITGPYASSVRSQYYLKFSNFSQHVGIVTRAFFLGKFLLLILYIFSTPNMEQTV